ncbi:hypothetical protein RvY_06022 [Ramazzottius varieornatus]|uniref:Uncharacterized protein n=1 Tax=Ramazzottius varieornatus TaxID=947166 RepID=A0A1D1V025_RAMVA|nr:hypothetical protein RvY_06022 [Ramazzottius varieornatus]
MASLSGNGHRTNRSVRAWNDCKAPNKEGNFTRKHSAETIHCSESGQLVLFLVSLFPRGKHQTIVPSFSSTQDSIVSSFFEPSLVHRRIPQKNEEPQARPSCQESAKETLITAKINKRGR